MEKRKRVSNQDKFIQQHIRKHLGIKGRRPTIDEKIVALCEKSVGMTREEKLLRLRNLAKSSLWRMFLIVENYGRVSPEITNCAPCVESYFLLPNFPFFVCPICGGEDYTHHEVPDDTNPREVRYGGDITRYPGECVCNKCKTTFTSPVQFAYAEGKNPFVLQTLPKPKSS